MDRQLAERMVGAACLLAVLVLVVPSILDGNQRTGKAAPESVSTELPDLRTHTLSLNNAERVPPVPQLGAIPGEPAGTLPAEELPAEEITAPLEMNSVPPPASAALPEPEKPPVAATATDEAAASSPILKKPVLADAAQWYVQLGVFASSQNAEGLAKKLKAKGFDATIRKSSGSMSRVIVGPRADREAAAALAEKLASAGFKGQVTRL